MSELWFKHVISHPPRSFTASSNFFSFMAFCTSLVCRSNPEGIRTRLYSQTWSSNNGLSKVRDNSPSPHTPWEAGALRSYQTGRWHKEECLVWPPSGPPPPPRPAYSSGDRDKPVWSLAWTEHFKHPQRINNYVRNVTTASWLQIVMN